MSVRRRAFTLIELLVVIAIIAILAAILFPVFAKAREKARQSSCQSNNKQMALAFQQYKQDYDETWPLQYWGGASWMPTASGWWGGEVQPYIKNSQIYLCPSITRTVTAQILGGACMGSASGVADAALTAPASTIFLGAGTSDSFQAGADAAGWIGTPGGSSRLLANHNDGDNFAYADGHVKWLSKTNFLPHDWNPTWTP